MDPRPPSAPTYTLDLFADPSFVKDVVKAILHTIFFHRYFTPITPLTRDLLDTTLPAIDDVDLETLIDQRATALVRAIDTKSYNQQAQGGGQGGRGQIAVQFFETKRKRKPTARYFGFGGKADEDICWEMWVLDVTLATPKTESDTVKVRRAMEKSLQKTAMKIITIVSKEKDHIPPITTTDTNPFPYQILVNPKTEGWGQRMGIF
ncbi:DUF1649-domain-containing protein [Aulographum hederae CBS 113979]|uniref:Autophagy-related protein 101 n=1 Tax=Aulographum hederae CBS 113979 TaxID=1176131 RepID=A0A6G1GRJ4_9PEZI|nr:DUF1649-domain-containing protein [Aulographum hederae CBS 113979]